MSYKIVYQPVNRIERVVNAMAEKGTAAEAWKTVDGLMKSDEKVEITDPDGIDISWQELRILAEEESQ